MVAANANLVVVDTNVVSYIFRGDGKAAYYLRRIRDRRALISFQTLEEVWYGAYSAGWGDRRRSELARHLEQYDVVWPNPELVEVCAQLRSQRKSVGRELAVADAWIAATAVLLKCPLASHDGDFSGIPNLQLIRVP